MPTKTLEQRGGPGLPGLGALIGDLRRLTDLMLVDDYDEQFVRPSQAAFEKAWEVLAEGGADTNQNVPPASPAAVGDGGLLVQWTRGDRHVFLAVPADPAAAYIYARDKDYRRTHREVSGVVLASCLDWLAQG